MKNIEELRNVLVEVLTEVKNGEIDLKKAKEMSNLSRNIVDTVKVQVTYNKLMGEKRIIEFLEKDSEE